VRTFNYFGVAVSAAGILTMIPGLVETMRMIFGPGMIVWSIWLGVVLLMGSRSESSQPLAFAFVRKGVA
jgi:hypothetical protein